MGNTIKIQPEFGFSTNISSEDIKKFADLYVNVNLECSAPPLIMWISDKQKNRCRNAQKDLLNFVLKINEPKM